MVMDVESRDRQFAVSDAERPENPGSFSLNAARAFQSWIDLVAPCPWSAHSGSVARRKRRAFAAAEQRTQAPLYTPEQRARRDETPWTLIQGLLAPLQFVVFAISLVLVVRYLSSGEGYALATGSIVVKTLILYTIMITGSIWEKVVFGKWLFAPAFFWEDVVSMGVLALHTAYLAMVLFAIGTPEQQMVLALAAYATYVINAGQFIWKLRVARLEGAPT